MSGYEPQYLNDMNARMVSLNSRLEKDDIQDSLNSVSEAEAVETTVFEFEESPSSRTPSPITVIVPSEPHQSPEQAIELTREESPSPSPSPVIETPIVKSVKGDEIDLAVQVSVLRFTLLYTLRTVDQIA